MKLQTQVPIPKADNQIDYQSHVLLLGSCFVEHIGDKLDYYKFNRLQNPFGILFHPLAITNLVARSILGLGYSEEDIFYQNERWHCFDAHSDLSAVTKEVLLQKLNDGLEATRVHVAEASHIVITLGTAWAYRKIETNAIVANCHKVPQKEFFKELLSIETIVKNLEKVMDLIRSTNVSAQIIFTVSPVRHLKDGFVENQQSKAHLITAIHHILENNVSLSANDGYFPAYEIMMDELRDYRFYASDMVHPNQLAIAYIWEKFKDVWITNETYEIMAMVEAIQKGLEHQPFNTESEAHQAFLKSLETKITYLQQRYPFMEFTS